MESPVRSRIAFAASILFACTASALAGCVGIIGDFPVGADAGVEDATPAHDGTVPIDGGHDSSVDARGQDTGTPADTGADTNPNEVPDTGVDAPPVDAFAGCNSTQLLCGGSCVPIDKDNCGQCGVACSGGTPECAPTNGVYGCVSGCPLATPTLCGTTCTDTTKDPSNCKTCENVCTTNVTGATATCTNSACGYACPANDTYCASSNSCVDLASDDNNCKTCGNVCPSPSTCQSSACTCPSPDTLCGTTCVNESSDPNNCNGCGSKCATNESCVDKSCTCESPYLVCSGTCTDPMSDMENCGS